MVACTGKTIASQRLWLTRVTTVPMRHSKIIIFIFVSTQFRYFLITQSLETSNSSQQIREIHEVALFLKKIAIDSEVIWFTSNIGHFQKQSTLAHTGVGQGLDQSNSVLFLRRQLMVIQFYRQLEFQISWYPGVNNAAPSIESGRLLLQQFFDTNGFCRRDILKISAMTI